MSKIRFSETDIEILSKNQYILKVSEKAITYTNEFKKHFISEHNKGKSAIEIFEEADFNIDIIGIQRVSSSSKRWLKAYKENGDLGLEDTRKHHSGRPIERELSKDEIIERQQVEIEVKWCVF